MVEQAVAAAVPNIQINDLQKKVNQVYQSLFEELFLSNDNQPLTLTQCKEAFRVKFGTNFTQDLESDLEEFFSQADSNND